MRVAKDDLLWRRAKNRCEYCALPAAYYPLPFQIDHIIAKKHHGTDSYTNLALACFHCNRHKGPNVAGVDPETKAVVRLFHPRKDVRSEHFVWDGDHLRGLTQVGRVTVEVLLINHPDAVAVRKALREEGVVFGTRSGDEFVSSIC